MVQVQSGPPEHKGNKKGKIMNDINEKYLQRILGSAKEGLVNANAALETMNESFVSINEQREEMEDAIKEISDLLGIPATEEAEEEEEPKA